MKKEKLLIRLPGKQPEWVWEQKGFSEMRILYETFDIGK